MHKSFNKHIKPGMHPLFIRVMKGMLPKNRIGRRLIENMHMYIMVPSTPTLLRTLP